jgi:hypothetical protein
MQLSQISPRFVLPTKLEKNFRSEELEGLSVVGAPQLVAENKPLCEIVEGFAVVGQFQFIVLDQNTSRARERKDPLHAS